MKFSLILVSLIVFCSSSQPILSTKPQQGKQREQIKENRSRKVQDDHEKKLRQSQKFQDNQRWEKNKYCAVWKGLSCQKCAQATYWNGKTCVPSSPNCKTFDIKDGCCTSCYGGYVLNSGQCIVAEPQKIDPLCHQFKNGKCVQCSFRAYFGKNGQCEDVNPLCNTFDYHDGCCTSCYSGYRLNNGLCVIIEPQQIDPLCGYFKNGKCIQCSYRAYFGKNGQCVNVNPLCNNFDYHDGCCTSCYAGYKLTNGECVIDYDLNGYDSDDHHKKTQSFKKDDRSTYSAKTDIKPVNPTIIVDPPSKINNPIAIDNQVYNIKSTQKAQRR